MTQGVEIERKFLVDEPPGGLNAHPSREIEQGYVALDGDTEVRIRRSGEQAYLTVKSGGGGQRLEEVL